jgi:hypothetical protein
VEDPFLDGDFLSPFGGSARTLRARPRMCGLVRVTSVQGDIADSAWN